MKFLKYEFTPTQWATAKAKIQNTVTNPDGSTEKVWDSELVTAVVELGKLCIQWGKDPEGMQICLKESAKVSVDILWAGDPLTTSFASYVVWPDPCGVHTFAGWESDYQTEFCQVNPGAPCCQIPAPIEL
jgi:hypothetical protein